MLWVAFNVNHYSARVDSFIDFKIEVYLFHLMRQTEIAIVETGLQEKDACQNPLFVFVSPHAGAWS